MPPPNAESAAAAAARLMGRVPDRLWRYATASDETAFFIARWDLAGSRKTVRTVSWDSVEGWRFAAWPGGRPLYDLPSITRRTEAAVIVCEGEIAADAAGAFFPERAATTSSCGASEARRSDWTPLAGREALIWPDHDGVGEAYGREVSKILTDLGCRVMRLDPSALGVRTPGLESTPPPKWDAADAVALSLRGGRSLADLRAAALACAGPFG